MKKTKLWLALGATLFSASFATASFADNLLEIDLSGNPSGDLGQIINSSTEVSNDGTVRFINAGTFTFSSSTPIAKSGLKFIGASDGTTILEGAGQPLFVNQTPSRIENMAFQDFRATDNGGVVNSNGDVATHFVNATFSSNLAPDAGGAIYVNRNFSGEIRGSSFTGNTAQYGGAIDVNRNFSGEISDSSFKGNSAAISGGAILVDGDFSGGIVRSSFTGNTAELEGGAIVVDGDFSGEISSSSFTGNTAELEGGAIYVVGEFSREISDSIFTGNRAEKGHGGAINVGDFSGEIRGSSFTGNAAGNSGGAISVEVDFSGGIVGSSFTGNTAGLDGGAIYVNGIFSREISGSSFTGNKSQGGGAIYVLDFSGEISSSSFTDNKAKSGGAIYLDYSSSSAPGNLRGSKFFNNSADDEGGAIYFAGETYLVAENEPDSTEKNTLVFAGNTANGEPNAIHVDNWVTSFSIAAGENNSIEFFDPISSDDSNKDLTLAFNANYDSVSGALLPNKPNTGTILFDSEQSKVYFERGATLYGGTMILQNGATFGADIVKGSYEPDFTVKDGATLLVQYEQDSPVRKQDGQVRLNKNEDEIKDFNIADLPAEIQALDFEKTKVDYDSKHISALNANLMVETGAALAFKIPEKQGENGALLSVKGNVVFENDSIINIESYAEGKEEGDNRRKLLDAASVRGFDNVKLEFGGETAVTDDEHFENFMHGKLEKDGNAIYATTSLAWNTQKEHAHGNFKLSKGNSFTVESGLANRSGTFASGWDGTTLNKLGEGTLILAGQNSYTGETKVEGGTLEIGEGGSLASAKITTSKDTTLTVKGEFLNEIFIGESGSFNVSGKVGNATVANGATVSLSGESGNMNIASDATLNLSGKSGKVDIGARSTVTLSGTAGILNIGPDSTLDFSGASGEMTLGDRVTMNIGQFTHESSSAPARKTRGAAPVPKIDGNFDAKNSDLNFTLPVDLYSGQTLLDVTGAADIDGATVNLVMKYKDTDFSALQVGEAVNLISADSLSGVYKTGKEVNALKGSTLVYEFELSTVGVNTPNGARDTLRATLINEASATDSSTSLVDGQQGGVAIAAQGGDLVAGAGMLQAMEVTQSGVGVMPFGAVMGGKSSYDIGSNFNLRHFNYLAGLAYGKAFAPGAMTVGAFFEYGRGNYNSFGSYADGDVRGDGKTHYEGGGVLARFEFGGATQLAPLSPGGRGVGGEGENTSHPPFASQTAPSPSRGEGKNSHAYVEASFRAGRVHNDYASRNLEDVSGVKAKFQTGSNYFGAHLGGGYIFELAEKTHVDVYGKVLWTRVGSDSTRLSTGERLKFDAVNSESLKVGAKWTTQVTKQVAPYVGVAYEYAFDGKAKATTDGRRIAPSELKGGTGIVNAGMTFAPGATLPLLVDLDVSGYAGERQGVAGGVKLKYTW